MRQRIIKAWGEPIDIPAGATVVDYGYFVPSGALTRPAQWWVLVDPPLSRAAKFRLAWLRPLCLVAWLVLVACVWAVAR